MCFAFCVASFGGRIDCCCCCFVSFCDTSNFHFHALENADEWGLSAFSGREFEITRQNFVISGVTSHTKPPPHVQTFPFRFFQCFVRKRHCHSTGLCVCNVLETLMSDDVKRRLKQRKKRRESSMILPRMSHYVFGVANYCFEDN